ncbi:MAG TPA: SGNH/GDSL hydrolase family protein [Puia sp.]|nr:SGNH/GDSL hydrolase family protein [Puia sp.]
MKKILVLFLVSAVLFSFTQKKMTWVALGDSITYLNDHRNETANRITSGFMTMVTKKLPDISFINQGHNGWTATDIANSIEKLGLVKADIYTVFLGTNDWWRGNPVGSLADYQNSSGSGTLYGSFRIIINKIKSLNTDAKIILMTPMQRSDFVYINDAKNNAYGSYKEKNGQMLEQFAVAIDSIASLEHFPLVDLFHAKGMAVKDLVKYKRLKDPKTGVYKNFSYPDYIGIPFNPATDEYPYPVDAADITFDGLHPSDKGYEKITDMLVKIMKKYL